MDNEHESGHGTEPHALRVFVIEGESPLMRLLVWGLQQEGIDAITAPAPDVATDGYGGRGGHLIVINADQPQEVRAKWINLVRLTSPGVAVIDLPHDGDAVSGADAVLPKPYRMEKLIRLIHTFERHD